jgi:hypothetical protein
VDYASWGDGTAMTMKLIASAGIALLLGACSLRLPNTPVAYTSLRPDSASVGEVAAPGAAAVLTDASPVLPPIEAIPPVAAMPGDFIGAIPERAKGTLDPVAVLEASSAARARWKTLRPSELARAPLLANRLAFEASMQNGSAAATAAAVNLATQSYDRDAAMKRLLDGGQAAAKPICDGC